MGDQDTGSAPKGLCVRARTRVVRAFDVQKSSVHHADTEGHSKALLQDYLRSETETYVDMASMFLGVPVRDRTCEDAAPGGEPDPETATLPDIVLTRPWFWEMHHDTPQGAVILWPKDTRVVPDLLAYPLSISDLGVGISMIELENLNGEYMSVPFSFYEGLDVRASLEGEMVDMVGRPKTVGGGGDSPKAHAPGVDIPGIFLPGETLEHVRKSYASRWMSRDPILRTWKPVVGTQAWARNEVACPGFEPVLQSPGDAITLCYSDWKNVSEKTVSEWGHTTGTMHYYLVVQWNPPMYLKDQVIHALIAPGETTGSDGASSSPTHTWARACNAPELDRFELFVKNCRERLLYRAMERLGVRPNATNTFVTHNTSNVPRLVSRSPDADEEATHVAYYSGCFSTKDADGGVVIPAEDPSSMGSADGGASSPTRTRADAARDFLWIHGPYKRGVQGGSAWDMPASAHAVPASPGSMGKINGEFMIHLGASGCDLKRHGYVKLTGMGSRASA